MNARHVFALTLVGWFLMYPPWNRSKQAIDPDLPFRLWYQVAAFNSSSECRSQSAEVLERLDAQINESGPTKSAEEERLRTEARCVSDDDPRLKPK
jgi:hypothetical protein